LTEGKAKSTVSKGFSKDFWISPDFSSKLRQKLEISSSNCIINSSMSSQTAYQQLNEQSISSRTAYPQLL
jgi:hypothetical protein